MSSFERTMRRRAEQEQHRSQRREHRAVYGKDTAMRWLYHGTSGVLADSIQTNGIRVGGDGRAYLTDSREVALAYATWSTGMAAGMRSPYGAPTTDVGRKVAATRGHVAVVFGVRLPADTQLEREDAFPPPLPWDEAITDGDCFYLHEPVPAVAVGRWELFRPPELSDPAKLTALKHEGDLIATAFSRSRGGQAGGPFRDAIPDPSGLVEAVRDASPNVRSPHHGDGHWSQVAAVGERLLRAGCGADAPSLFAFALLHDSQRHAENRDPEHGARAATFARKLAAEGRLRLDARRLDVLSDALLRHDQAATSEDPTTGACWDSDRLTLARLGIAPDPALLSTSAGRDLAPDAYLLVARPAEWRFLVYRYHLAGAASPTSAARGCVEAR